MLFSLLKRLAVLLVIGVLPVFVDAKAVSLFSDEFNNLKDWPVDSTKWTLETGGWGWGNNELQFYRSSKDNASHNGNGSLVIRAVKGQPLLASGCWYGTCQYSSARMITKDKFEARYGRFEARIRIPRGQGIWPAFWLLGANIGEVGWPACGEIDVMENIGREPNIVHGTVHGPGYSGGNGIGGQYVAAAPFADDFHVFAVEWSPGKIEWFVDGNKFKTVTPADLPPGAPWVFAQEFFIILNVAVGGNWPGSPDASTVFPQEMLVDYVRVTELNV